MIPFRMQIVFVALALLAFTSCAAPRVIPAPADSGTQFLGTVHRNGQPLAGARVYVLVPAGYDSRSTSPAVSGTAGADEIGTYVLTGDHGQFALPDRFTRVPHAYLYASESGPARGTPLLAAIPPSPGAGQLEINEGTTLAFTTANLFIDPTHVTSAPGR